MGLSSPLVSTTRRRPRPASSIAQTHEEATQGPQTPLISATVHPQSQLLLEDPLSWLESPRFGGQSDSPCLLSMLQSPPPGACLLSQRRQAGGESALLELATSPATPSQQRRAYRAQPTKNLKKRDTAEERGRTHKRRSLLFVFGTSHSVSYSSSNGEAPRPGSGSLRPSPLWPHGVGGT